MESLTHRIFPELADESSDLEPLIREQTRMKNPLDTVLMYSNAERREGRLESWLVQPREVGLQEEKDDKFDKESYPTVERRRNWRLSERVTNSRE